MAGVDSEVQYAWLGTNPAQSNRVWPVKIIEKDAKKDECVVEWVPGPDRKTYEAFTVSLSDLKQWNDVANVVLTPVAQDAYDVFIKANPTVEDVLEGKTRVRKATMLFDGSPSSKRIRTTPAPAKKSPATKSQTKKPPATKSPAKNKVKYPSSLQRPKNAPQAGDERGFSTIHGATLMQRMETAVGAAEESIVRVKSAAGNAACLLIPPLTLVQVPSTIRSPSSRIRSPSSRVRTPSSRVRTPSTSVRSPSTSVRSPSSRIGTQSSSLMQMRLLQMRLLQMRLLQMRLLPSFHRWSPSPLLLPLLMVSAGSVCLVCVSETVAD